jgi:hypothetical protein
MLQERSVLKRVATFITVPSLLVLAPACAQPEFTCEAYCFSQIQDQEGLSGQDLHEVYAISEPDDVYAALECFDRFSGCPGGDVDERCSCVEAE